LAVISYEKYVDASVLVYLLTKRYADNPYHIYYIGDIQVFDFNVLYAQSGKDEVIVIDKLYTTDHVAQIEKLNGLGYCIICAVSKENHDLLIEIDRMSESTHFHLEELNEEETSKYVRYVAKEIG